MLIVICKSLLQFSTGKGEGMKFELKLAVALESAIYSACSFLILKVRVSSNNLGRADSRYRLNGI